MGAMVEIANVEQAAAWDGHEGDVWTEHADRYDRAGRRQLARFLDAGLINPDDAIVDIGCGTGRATREAARVAERGSALGIDHSARMLDEARRRSAAEGLEHVTFVQGDAQVHPFPEERFDLAMSSFGAMFFGDPVAAFTNISRSVKHGGRLALLAWRELDRNEWLLALRGALALGRDLPVPPPGVPSPFALADPDRVRPILDAAGFGDVAFTPVDEPMDFGRDAADAFAFVRTVGIVEGLLEGVSDDQRRAGLQAVKEALEAQAGPDGVLFDSSAWLITAARR
jgi:SAM-dependent methyltransferase